MVTYIKNNIDGIYVDFSVPLDPGIYSNIGSSWEDYLDGKWVQLSESQIAYHNENEGSSVSEVFFMKKEVEKTEAELLYEEKSNKELAVRSYDKSYIVNSFYIGDKALWFDKNERSGLIMRFEAEKKMGIKDTKIWYHNTEFSFPVEEAESMIYSLEVYASKCFDRTKEHINNIQNLKTIKDVQQYDFTAGYPEKLRFEYVKE